MGKIRVQHNVEDILGLSLIEPKMFNDNRGYLFEAYNEEDFISEGIDAKFVQDNEAHSKIGVLRGFGINMKHPQAKLIRVIHGSIYDVVIDLRKESKTYLKWYGIELSATNKRQLYIPEGFAHAYLVLSDADVLFKVTTHFILGDEIGFAWNSKQFGIRWPINEEKIILSDADKNNPDFSTLMW